MSTLPPTWCSDKECACQAGDLSSVPGWGRSPGEENGNPVQHSCLGSAMDRGAWQATVHGVSKESDTSELLSTEHFLLVWTPLPQCIFPLWIPVFSMKQFSKSSKMPPSPAQSAMISCKAEQPQYSGTVPLIWQWTQDCFEHLFSFLFIPMLLLCKEQEGRHQTDIGIISGLSFTGLQTLYRSATSLSFLLLSCNTELIRSAS